MAKGKLNIYRDTFLEKEELDHLVSFINDNPALFLFVSSTQQFGIIQQSVIDPAFLVQVGTNSDTVKVTADSYALDQNGAMIYQKAFDNLLVPTDGDYYWMKISHRYDNYETGFVDIAADGTLSGYGTTFTEVLRGQSSGFPVKLKFFTQANSGDLSAANNSGIYEVVSIQGDTTAVISGNLTPENNLKYVVLGAFSIKTSIAAITSDGMYSYDSCQIDFVAEETTDTAPTIGYTAGEDFYIARIMNDGAGTFTIEDKRLNYYFRLNFGDIAISDRAMIDASNLSAGNITSWLVKLNLYTQTQIDAFNALFLVKSQNLNDLANKTTARTNLDVYDKGTIDSRYPLRELLVNIGDWDMDTDASVFVAHTVVDWTKIREVTAMIRDDADDAHFMLNTVDVLGAAGPAGGYGAIGATTVGLSRVSGGFFDGSDFNATAYNRGYLIIKYIA